MALGPRTWAAAYVCGPKHAYIGTFLRIQLGFQKHGKFKFSTIIAEVWNEFHIVWNRSKPIFSTIKSLTWYIFKTHRNPTGKNLRFTRNIVNQKGIFYKTPLSQFYLIETSSSPNPFSLTLPIACLITCNRFDWGEQSKSKLGNSFLRYQASTLSFLFFVLILFLCLVYVYACFLRLVL